MADFNVDLTAPRGQGAQPVTPVQEQVVPAQPNQLLAGIANIFAKGLEADHKQAAIDRKTAVIQEYISNESAYNDAFTSGQWNSSQVSTASQANFKKLVNAYPQYLQDLHEARGQFQQGTALSEAQKQVDAETKLREEQKSAAIKMGLTFPPNASKEVEDSILKAASSEIRANTLSDRVIKMETEARAQRADQRAGAAEARAVDQYGYEVEQRRAKQEAETGILTAFGDNFEAFGKFTTSVIGNPTSSPEEKQLLISTNLSVIKAKMLAVSGRNASLAEPFMRVFDDISAVATKLSDPSIKSARDVKLLQDEFDSLLLKAKLGVMSDDKSRSAIAVSNLFGNNLATIGLGIQPAIMGTLARLGMGPGAQNTGVVPKVVDTKDEKEVLKGLQRSLQVLQSGTANGEPSANQVEAVNAVNEIVKQTGGLTKDYPPEKLKSLATFYSSPEFGKLAEKGLLDKESVENANKVFQVSFKPAVTDAIESRLSIPVERSYGRDLGNKAVAGKKPQTILESVDIRPAGNGISIVTKPGFEDTGSSHMERTAIKEAEGALNQVIRIGAHMEGTTDYAKYWENNKHLIMPSIYPDPAKLKPGQVVDGYKYLGGPSGVQSNWQFVGKSSSN